MVPPVSGPGKDGTAGITKGAQGQRGAHDFSDKSLASCLGDHQADGRKLVGVTSRHHHLRPLIGRAWGGRAFFGVLGGGGGGLLGLASSCANLLATSAGLRVGENMMGCAIRPAMLFLEDPSTWATGLFGLGPKLCQHPISISQDRM